MNVDNTTKDRLNDVIHEIHKTIDNGSISILDGPLNKLGDLIEKQNLPSESTFMEIIYHIKKMIDHQNQTRRDLKDSLNKLQNLTTISGDNIIFLIDEAKFDINDRSISGLKGTSKKIKDLIAKLKKVLKDVNEVRYKIENIIESGDFEPKEIRHSLKKLNDILRKQPSINKPKKEALTNIIEKVQDHIKNGTTKQFDINIKDLQNLLKGNEENKVTKEVLDDSEKIVGKHNVKDFGDILKQLERKMDYRG